MQELQLPLLFLLLLFFLSTSLSSSNSLNFKVQNHTVISYWLGSIVVLEKEKRRKVEGILGNYPLQQQTLLSEDLFSFE